MFWDFFQSRQIEALEKEQGKSKYHTSDLKRRVRELEEKVDHLSLICQAMWKVLKSNFLLEEKDLAKIVRKVDLVDGKTNKKNTKSPVKCIACRRMNHPRHEHCIYCGNLINKTSPFDAL